MNICTFIGRVGGDAEVRYTPNGKAVSNWSVAVDTGYGDNKSTMWVKCALWGDRAEKVSEYIKKGDNVGVSGELSVREYEGNKGKGFSVELNVRELKLLGGKAEQPAKPAKTAKPEPVTDDLNDEIPF